MGSPLSRWAFDLDLEISQGKQSRWGGRGRRYSGHLLCSGASGGSKGFRMAGCLATLWFHFNRLTPEPFLTDKGNENKSLSSAQQGKGKGALVCLCVYHTPDSTEDRRSSTLPLITYVFELPLSPSSCHLNFLLFPTDFLERLTFAHVPSVQYSPFTSS